VTEPGEANEPDANPFAPPRAEIRGDREATQEAPFSALARVARGVGLALPGLAIVASSRFLKRSDPVFPRLVALGSVLAVLIPLLWWLASGARLSERTTGRRPSGDEGTGAS
jgi:hypothetical protein